MDQFFRKTEISYFHMSFFINKQIFRFKVAIDYIFLVHVTDSKQNFTNIEHGNIVAKTSVFSQTIEQFTSWTELKYHVDKNFVLECSFEGIDEWMI